MRKIYQSVPDVPQAIANKAIDMVERHFTANGVKRAEELPEESKVRLMREIQHFLQTELPDIKERNGEWGYDWSTRRGDGIGRLIVRWFQRVFRWGSVERDQ
ncbi:MAG TPA: hypothetical protein VFI02_07630 [Armatimonadota bacterium]|nr:hypothetical protein [Armatimonadota bacterium]